MLTQGAYEFGVGEGAPSFLRENSTLGGPSDDDIFEAVSKFKSIMLFSFA